MHDRVDALKVSASSLGEIGESKSRRLLSTTGRLRDLSGAHIQVEDNVVFPKTARVLDNDAIGAIGLECLAKWQQLCDGYVWLRAVYDSFRLYTSG